MKKVFIILTAVILLNGCGVFNKVFKHKTSSSELTESSHSEKISSQFVADDNSIITITESLDTAVKTPVVNGQGKRKVNLETIKNGLNTIDDEFINLEQIYNPVDSTLYSKYTLKPQKVNVPKQRKTEIRNNIKTTKAENKESKEEDKKLIKKSDAIVERKADYKVIFIIIFIICLFIFAAWLFKRGVK
ncbi:hypothetical protein [Pedobacter cryoconitis]|uniref:Uncharacterized protein n=1 Tax=Pedobacter cryoconitis TaxID=188932 RepID=A0A327ST82_9SPHI|nr:hypothetical protein [Pedobacter cryoconitis]RAJ28857.1 hypothetical protein LY11_03131 [Pedobacter cryoconitis]